MKVSLNWMKQYGGQGLDAPIDELVERIGAQLGAIEEVENLGEKYQGIIVAKVMSCIDHPNADRLHVCMVDDGGQAESVVRDENGHVQVVCGAPNVREGLMVAWLPPGSTVPESVGKDPFVLEARELRGIVSNGMLASPKELALGDSHEGILEIDEAGAKPGDDFAKLYGLDDYIVDIENKMFTHRPDCFGQLGVAREIAGISGKKFTSPDWYTNTAKEAFKVEGSQLPLTVRNELPALVPRFMAIAMSDIVIKPSPVWLQSYLQRVGIRPINNVVDITNFFMLETGQPSHAYDYDKLKALDGGDGATIVVRNPRENEKLTLLNGKTIDPRQEAIMIASDSKLIGVGGVMGGAETEVDDDTKNIVLEVATFDMYSVRRTSMSHGLFTDAVTRFNKGQSPLQNPMVLAKLVAEIRRWADGKVASELIDDNHVDGREWVYPPVPVTTEFINTRLGFDLPVDEMKQLLENVEFTVKADGDKLTVTAPFWRTDIETREDVVEEVGRLYGFDHLPLVLPTRSVKPVQKDELLELKSAVRHHLAQAGANEVLTYSFVHGDLLNKVGQDQSKAFSLSNALSPDLQYYRLSLTPSVLTNVHANLKAGYGEFALFELGKAHVHGEPDPMEPEVPKEANALAFVYASQKPKDGAAYYYAKRQLQELLQQYQLEIRMECVPLDKADLYHNPWLEQMVAPYDPKRSAVLKKRDDSLIWGIVGEFKTSVKRALKLPDTTAGFELDPLLFLEEMRQSAYVALSKYPAVWQDITLKVKADEQFVSVQQLVQAALTSNAPEDTATRLDSMGIYQAKDDATHKNITFRVHITGLNRTLTDTEVGKTVDAIAAEAAKKLGAERI